MVRLAPSAAAEGEEGEEGAPEEECAAEFKPLVQLDEVEVQVAPSEPRHSSWSERFFCLLRFVRGYDNTGVKGFEP